MAEVTSEPKKKNWVIAYTLVILLVWSICMAAAVLWERTVNRQRTLSMAGGQAMSIYQVVTRISRSDSKNTTTMPSDQNAGHVVRLVSLDPADALTSPDAWETQALQALAKGSDGVSSIETVNGKTVLRFLKPWRDDPANQDPSSPARAAQARPRKAVSILVPMEPLQRVSRCEINNLAVGYIIAWCGGVLFILTGHAYLRRQRQKHLQCEDLLLEKIQQVKHDVVKKNRFLSNMSHEIRTPMNSILGFTELLMGDELTDEQKEYLQTVQNSGKGLLELINDILDLSKIESGKMKITKKMVLLDPIINDVRALMAQTISNRGLTFKLLKTMGVPQQFYTDPLRLKQCLINLINNAVKFTESGSITLHVNQYRDKKQQWLRFDVQDTGIGIPPEKLNDLFREFVQLDDAMADRYGGSGLGLAITQQLTEMMGGKITVQSEQGAGTTFSIHLPMLASAGSENQPSQTSDASA